MIHIQSEVVGVLPVVVALVTYVQYAKLREEPKFLGRFVQLRTSRSSIVV
jgi:hypothetical protein